MPEVLGTGFRWAFDGEPGLLILPGSDGLVDPATIEGMPGFPSKASQFAGLRVLAGPPGAEIGRLRREYGYRPKAMPEVEASRLEWEASYVQALAGHPASRAELRVRLRPRASPRAPRDVPGADQRVISVLLGGEARPIGS